MWNPKETLEEGGWKHISKWTCCLIKMDEMFLKWRRWMKMNHEPMIPTIPVSPLYSLPSSAVSASIRVSGACWGFFRISLSQKAFVSKIHGFLNHQIGDPFWSFGDKTPGFILLFRWFMNHQIQEVSLNICHWSQSRNVGTKRKQLFLLNFSPPRKSSAVSFFQNPPAELENHGLYLCYLVSYQAAKIPIIL